MAKLKPGANQRPQTGQAQLPMATPRPLACAAVLAPETVQGTIEPAKLIAPMLGSFMASDRAFARARRIN
jgi:hypothetical protein